VFQGFEIGDASPSFLHGSALHGFLYIVMEQRHL
jgi:hypothetical protein